LSQRGDLSTPIEIGLFGRVAPGVGLRRRAFADARLPTRVRRRAFADVI